MKKQPQTQDFSKIEDCPGCPNDQKPLNAGLDIQTGVACMYVKDSSAGLARSQWDQNQAEIYSTFF